MGVSLPGGGGGGRGRSSNFDLNLVPFIDLLSTCITFLIATAVWTQISAMKVDQAISDPNQQVEPPETPPVPPLSVHVRADGVWAGRNIETGKNMPMLGTEYDWFALEDMLKADHEQYPDETQVVIITDDGIEYQFMIKALDISRAVGYDKTLLGGGPASQNAALSAPPPAAGG